MEEQKVRIIQNGDKLIFKHIANLYFNPVYICISSLKLYFQFLHCPLVSQPVVPSLVKDPGLAVFD